MTLISDVIKATPIGGYIASIRLIAEGLLLVATILLGIALHHAYEAEGVLKATSTQQQGVIVAYQKQTQQQQQSCAATDAIVNKTDLTKETISHETDNSLQEVAKIATEYKEMQANAPTAKVPMGVQNIPVGNVDATRDAALLRVLNTAYCQASHYGDSSTCNTPQ